MISQAEMAKSNLSLQFGPLVSLIFKVGITAGCFWFVASQLNFTELLHAGKTLRFGWAALATLAICAQAPLIALRWTTIVKGIPPGINHLSYAPMLAITAISIFFGQVLPNVVGDTMRITLFNRLQRGLGRALTSVVIDRGIGIGALFVVGCLILSTPSQFVDLMGYRYVFLGIFAAAVFASLLGLTLAPFIVSILNRWQFLSWISLFLEAAHSVFFRSLAGLEAFGLAILVHGFTIVSVWCLMLALDLTLPFSAAVVLFTIIVAVALVPVSVGGWGVREVAVVTFLQSHSIAAERALIFSVYFGLVLLVGSLPGAVVWILSGTRK
jgi:glycosyltransferase 2 family protein